MVNNKPLTFLPPKSLGRALVMGCLGSGLLLLAHLAQGSESSITEKFRSQYPAASARWQEYLSQIHVAGTLKMYQRKASPAESNAWDLSGDIGPGDSLRETRKIELWRQGRMGKLIETVSRERPAQKKGAPQNQKEGAPQNTPGELTICVGPKYSFRSIKKAGEAPVLASFSATKDSDALSSRLLDGFIWAPYWIGRPFREFTSDPSFSIKSASKIDLDGKEMVKVEFSIKPADPHVSLRGGWVIFSPADGWAIRRYELSEEIYSLKTKSKRIREDASYGDIQYDYQSGRLPLPKRVYKRHFNGVSVFEPTVFEVGPVSEREFTLASVGLPELEQPAGQSRTSRLPFWLFGLAAVALVVALVLKYTAARVRRG
ncbi:MAG: hypothetical protein IRY99_16755 [Isosphaeraceae bacterium]|nr:hypothetical protein [Isosphaeraceae bacterium]